ncbi:MAG TPA: serine protease [Candidatus Binatia bacterium]|nr:serine protease [Candidatus Binatia bacterium]
MAFPVPRGRLKPKGKEFHEIVADYRHIVCSVIRQRPMPGLGIGAKALGTGFFVARDIFITCDHVMNSAADPHQPGDSYALVANLTGTSGKMYPIQNPTIGQEINLFPNLDLAVLRVPNTPQDQPYAPLEYGDVYEGEGIGVVGYPLPMLQTVNGNITFNAVIYRAARGSVTAFYTANDGSLLNVPCIEVNFLFVPGNSGGPVFGAKSGRVFGFVRGFRPVKIREAIATATMIQQMPLGLSPQYIESISAVYSTAIKLNFVRATLDSFGVTL